MSEGVAVDDLYDITRAVRPVRVNSPALAEPIDVYTNGKSFFLTADQVATLAAALGPDRIAPTLNTGSTGWQEQIEGKGVRVLAERHIHGGTYYRFRKHWDFTTVEA